MSYDRKPRCHFCGTPAICEDSECGRDTWICCCCDLKGKKYTPEEYKDRFKVAQRAFLKLDDGLKEYFLEWAFGKL